MADVVRSPGLLLGLGEDSVLLCHKVWHIWFLLAGRFCTDSLQLQIRVHTCRELGKVAESHTRHGDRMDVDFARPLAHGGLGEVLSVWCVAA
jgi:hypothetical protein